MKLADPTLLKSRCLIDGKWTGEGVTAVTNPATGEIIAHVPHFGAEEATQAVEAAQRAFKPWAKKTAKERANIMRNWFNLIIANKEDLALIMTSPNVAH